MAVAEIAPRARAAAAPRRWMPKQAMITPAALEHEHGRAIAARCAALRVDVRELSANRLTGLRDGDPREAARALAEARTLYFT